MTHKDAPPETASQVACREFWQKAQPHVTRAWGRAKDGSYLAENSRLLHKAWEQAAALAQQPAAPLEPEPELDAYDPKSGGKVAQWLYRAGLQNLAFVVRTQLDIRAPQQPAAAYQCPRCADDLAAALAAQPEATR